MLLSLPNHGSKLTSGGQKEDKSPTSGNPQLWGNTGTVVLYCPVGACLQVPCVAFLKPESE